MDITAFLAQLRRQRFAFAYLLLGGDLYLRDLCREQVIEAAIPLEARGLAVARFSLKDVILGEVIRQALTLPMLSPRQVLVVRDLQRAGESEVEALEKYFGDPSPATVLVFETERLDRRTRLSRLLVEKCVVLEVDSPREDADVQDAAQRFARDMGLQLEPAAVEDLVFAVGGDLSQLRHELEKLRAYVGPASSARPEDVAAVVVPARQFTVFELADLLAEQRRGEALARVRHLLQAGESPVGIVGLLAWLYRQLLQVQSLPHGTAVWQVRTQLAVPRPRAEALLRQARRFTRSQLEQALPLLLEADWALKSSPPDATAILETLILRLTSRPDQPARARS